MHSAIHANTETKNFLIPSISVADASATSAESSFDCVVCVSACSGSLVVILVNGDGDNDGRKEMGSIKG
eukprot:CAMPEP_0202698598 /NCGR_PEP_ID=MMETSP1385-20130828/11870_1 /ASSEMBLY_ACC=CAM_ASM_000861 /TAXON_ID=933848 /ORGANISM="Elphidium margaritaceum" /LENGTH=68 /DNA_ID=CAMNT_0049355351 /DNA_START=189 /DNA_END=395 /DNA_ORIENTATION=-